MFLRILLILIAPLSFYLASRIAIEEWLFVKLVVSTGRITEIHPVQDHCGQRTCVVNMLTVVHKISEHEVIESKVPGSIQQGMRTTLFTLHTLNVGDAVDILYNPDTPSKAKLKSKHTQDWAYFIIFIIIGIGLLCLGLRPAKKN